MKSDSPGPRKPALAQDTCIQNPRPEGQMGRESCLLSTPIRAATFPGLQLLQKQLTLGSSFHPFPPLSGNTERFANSSDYNCCCNFEASGVRRNGKVKRKEGEAGKRNEGHMTFSQEEALGATCWSHLVTSRTK